MDFALTADFWVGVAKIIWINVILSGDNAVVIALAARTLPPHQQTKAVVFGSSAAVVLRVLLTIVAARLMAIAFLQIVGGALLLWIGLKLLLDEDGAEGEDGPVAHGGNLLAAVRTILVADLVMSLDNVIAVAAAAGGDMVLLILGLAISIPLVVFGSTLLIKLMERFPAIVVIGAGLIGWVAGEAIVGDSALAGWLAGAPWVHYAGPALGAIVVVLGARLVQARAAAQAVPVEEH